MLPMFACSSQAPGSEIACFIHSVNESQTCKCTYLATKKRPVDIVHQNQLLLHHPWARTTCFPHMWFSQTHVIARSGHGGTWWDLRTTGVGALVEFLTPPADRARKVRWAPIVPVPSKKVIGVGAMFGSSHFSFHEGVRGTFGPRRARPPSGHSLLESTEGQERNTNLQGFDWFQKGWVPCKN